MIEPKGRDSRKQIVIFKNVTTVLILKTCFDVANIIISYIKFEKKPLDYITTKRNVHT